MEKYLDSLVLVVDDEPANIFLLQCILEGEGYRVATAKDGKKALAFMKERPPDVVLLDLMMPEMDGFAVLKQIASDPAMCQIPVIVVSAKIDVEDVKIALDLGALDYIRKPVDEEELFARLRSALRLKSREDHLRRLIALKEQFISIVSHDLRSPLTTIITYVEMMTMLKQYSEGLSAEHLEFLDTIHQEGTRMNDYLNKLLNLAFLESGTFKLSRSVQQLSALVERSSKDYQAQMEKKGISFEVDAPPDVSVDVDETLFIQVLNNLISNAMKFTKPSGKVKVSVSRDGEKTVLRVSDTGLGIDAEGRKRLFSEFSKHYSWGTDGEPGTGLGLSICKKILDAHGFDISVQSEPGVGTEFAISMGGIGQN
jgi:signal transduction histidine kinase